MKNIRTSRDRRIQKKRAQLIKLEKEIKKLQKELKNLGQTKKQKSTGKKQKRNRPLSERWKKILCYIGQAGPAGISSQEILAYCVRAELAIQAETFRAQMSLYGSRRFIKRIKESIFALTELGAQAANWSETEFDSKNADPSRDFLRGDEDIIQVNNYQKNNEIIRKH